MITSAKLNAAIDNAIDIAWTPGFDGETPILRYVLQYCLLANGKRISSLEAFLLQCYGLLFRSISFVL